jgi:hypothetical protein
VTEKGEIDPREIPEVEIGATAQAKRVRFEREPETEVTLHGDERSHSESERENLPDEVEPGVEYRDVEVRWGAAAYVEVEEAPELRRREAAEAERDR